jgi:hypothetical protein
MDFRDFLNLANTLVNGTTEGNRSDYDAHLTVHQAMARNHIQRAEEIIQALDTAAIDPVRTQITDAMKIYERDVLKDVTWHP